MSSVLASKRLSPMPPKNAPKQLKNFQRRVKKWKLAKTKLLNRTAGIIPTVPNNRVGNISRNDNSSKKEIISK